MKEEKNWLEWSVFGISIILIAALLGSLIYLSVTHKQTKPNLRVALKYDEKQEDKHIHHIVLRNEGGMTAEEIKIQVIAWQNGKEVEKADITFPFSPKFSTREGWVSFRQSPADLDSVSAKVLGYLKL